MNALRSLIICFPVFFAIAAGAQTDKEFFDRGCNKLSLRDYYGAIEDFDKAVRYNSNHSNAYNNRGICKYNLKDYKRAIEDFDKAIEINPDYLDAYYNRSLARFMLEDYKGVIEDIDRMIDSKPKFADAYYLRGLAKVGSGQNDSGCMDLKKAAELGLLKALADIRTYCNP
jgi:tetratricopeptide (TPR) repeat protein